MHKGILYYKHKGEQVLLDNNPYFNRTKEQVEGAEACQAIRAQREKELGLPALPRFQAYEEERYGWNVG